jgi:uncharacterized membrane protein
VPIPIAACVAAGKSKKMANTMETVPHNRFIHRTLRLVFWLLFICPFFLALHMIAVLRQRVLERSLVALPKTELGEKKEIKKNNILMVVALFLINFGFEIPLANLKADIVCAKLMCAIPKD